MKLTGDEGEGLSISTGDPITITAYGRGSGCHYNLTPCSAAGRVALRRRVLPLPRPLASSW